MISMQDQVMEFHEKFGMTVGMFPQVRDKDLRINLIAEEATETADAIRSGDLAGTIDGLCDLAYVSLGALVAFGIKAMPYVPIERGAIGLNDPVKNLRRLVRASVSAIDAIEAGDLAEIRIQVSGMVSTCLDIASEFGIDLSPFFDEVHRTNMLKEGGSKRPDGKVLKPDGWQPPRIKEMLEEQIAAFNYEKN